MSPRTVTDDVVRETPVLTADTEVGVAVARLLEAGLPALPVVDGDKFVGIFGEREFMAALFPGYLKDLRHARFMSKSLDEALEKREACREETVGQHMNTEHVEVDADFADTQVAEIFLHHRVLVVPVVEDGRLRGVLTRGQFFRALAERFVDG